MSIFAPERISLRRPDTRDARWKSIVRSYLFMRTIIGLLGMELPALLLIGDGIFIDGDLSARGSLSEYYHSGMRDVFVGTFIVVGIFLLTYKMFERSLDNLLSIIAGLGALGLAIFPTGLPDDALTKLTPLQHELGEGFVQGVHFTFAAMFIGALAVISAFFGSREAKRRRRPRVVRNPLPAGLRRAIHWTCSAAIVIAILYIAVTKAFGLGDEHSLLIGESAAAVAFGISWAYKGLELDMLFPQLYRDEPSLEQ